MKRKIYEVDHHIHHSAIVSHGVKLGDFYAAELAELVVKLLNEHPPKARPTPDEDES